MAGFYHVEMKIVRKSGGSGRAAAGIAYIMRNSVQDLDTGVRKHSADQREDLEAAGIEFPEWLSEETKHRWRDPAVLAQAVEHAENRPDGQIFRSFLICFDKNLSETQRLQVTKDICAEFNKEGMFVIYGIHRDKADNKNFHVHMLVPMREFDKDGNFKATKQKRVYANCIQNGKPSYNPQLPTDEKYRIPIIDPKTNEQKIEKKTGRKCWQRVTIERNPWDNRNNFERWRRMIAEIENKYLSDENKVDWRSYKRQGIDKIPMENVGIKAQKMQERFEKAIDTLSVVDQEKWIKAIGDMADERLSQEKRQKAKENDENYKKELSSRSRCKPSPKYFGRYNDFGDEKINVESLAIFVHEYLKNLAVKIKESTLSFFKIKKSENQIRKDVLIIHNFGMTKPMERHFRDAGDVIRDQRIEKLEKRLSVLQRREKFNGEIGHAASGLVEAIGDIATDAGSSEEDREASENYKRFMRTEVEVADAIVRCATSLVETGIENRRAEIRESRNELADQRAKERTAAKERADRNALRIGLGTGEGTEIKRKM